MSSKVEGQLRVLRESLSEDPEAIKAVEGMIVGIRWAESVDAILALEAKAASAYWGAWNEVPIRFARADERLVPDHWRSFGERQSPLNTSPRKAATPMGAILNYLYALAEFECRLALLAVGLDPGLGWAHRDAPYRDSAALDLLEALRPSVDTYVVELVGSRTFARREFTELPTGQVRLMPELARSLATSILATWERLASSQAEAIAKRLARATGVSVRIPGRATRGAKGKGRATLGRRIGGRRRTTPPSACRTCGVVLETSDRMYCPDCVPGFKQERTQKLVIAARSVLEEMRASDHDPAQTLQAKARRVAAYKGRKEAAREWALENPGPHDPAVYRSEILPGLASVTVPQMMRATRLTSGYCWKIRRGERTPHSMYWASLLALVKDQS